MTMSQGWREALADVLASPEYGELKAYIGRRRSEGIRVYPPPELIYNALRRTPFEKIKVVILGQDPYHGPGQANGLAFAVNEGVPRPPSLRNIIKELQADLQKEIRPTASTLLGWAEQGVLLLNTSLSVEEGRPGSHSNTAWTLVVDAILKAVAAKKTPVVAMLWGDKACSKKATLGYNVKVLEAGHPSALNAAKFFGCKHFSQANQYLISKGIDPIDWTRIDIED